MLASQAPRRPLPLRAVYEQHICRVTEKAGIELKATVLFFFPISFTSLLRLVWCDPPCWPPTKHHSDTAWLHVRSLRGCKGRPLFQRRYAAGAQSCSGLLKSYFSEAFTKVERNQGVCAARVSGRQLLQSAPHLGLCLCLSCFVCFSPTNPGLFSFSAALISQ